MSKLVSVFQGMKEALANREQLLAAYAAAYPELCSINCGVRSPDGTQVLWPHTLMVFAQQDKLKWTLHDKFHGTSLFGCFDDFAPDLDEIERHLAAGKFETKAGKSK